LRPGRQDHRAEIGGHSAPLARNDQKVPRTRRFQFRIMRMPHLFAAISRGCPNCVQADSQMPKIDENKT